MQLNKQSSLPDYRQAVADKPTVVGHCEYPPTVHAPARKDVSPRVYPILSIICLSFSCVVLLTCIAPGASIIDFYNVLTGDGTFAVGLWSYDPYWQTIHEDILPSLELRNGLAAAHVLSFLFVGMASMVLAMKTLKPGCLDTVRDLALFTAFWIVYGLAMLCIVVSWTGDWSILSRANQAGLDPSVEVVFEAGRISREMPLAFLLLSLTGIFVGMYQKREREEKLIAAKKLSNATDFSSTVLTPQHAPVPTISDIERATDVKSHVI